MARPTKYRAEFAEQARKLCLLGATDAETAWFLEIDMQTFSDWKSFYPEFNEALNPSCEEVEEYRLRRALKGKRRSVARNAYRRENPSVRISDGVRSRMWAALKGRSDGRLFSRLGYSIDELMSHLEAQFKPGMSWENYGKWHIDHIKPCALFNQEDDAEFAECWSLNNLQPLWASENVRKGASYGGT